MDAIIGIAFLLSGFTNGADLTMGIGFAEKQNQFINPIGIVELSTPLYEDDKWSLKLGFSHFSSIPDARDNGLDTHPDFLEGGTNPDPYNPYNADLNMVSIKATVRFAGL